MDRKKILIVDDNPKIIFHIMSVFEKHEHNYYFYQANNAKMALHIAKEKTPDLILTDWEMPEMSGIELIQMLKNNDSTKDIPVIMVTGIMTEPKHLKTAFEAGAIDYIRKPIDETELVARTRSMIMLSTYHKETIELKNRELAATTLNILKNNEFNDVLLTKLQQISLKIPLRNITIRNLINNLISETRIKVKHEAWTLFYSYFKKINTNFYETLFSKYPDLTPAELKLCVLLRMNLNSKEIASITFLEPTSIKTARTRLRKKLNLDNKTNLSTYLVTL